MADQTLPELIRSKYPGQYDDLTDEQLDSKVRDKYKGVYDDIPKPKAKQQEAKPSTPTPPPGVVSRADKMKAFVQANPQPMRAPNVVSDAVTGGIKRVGDTAIGLPLAVERGARAISGYQAPPGGPIEALNSAHRALQPTNLPQKVGAGIADVGMYAAMPEI